ncbi:hypothetical protein DDB_G0292144 [Dictyostelium discoideum AX4]|uniref:BTB domain-containing protein n=1 Tax=Dictyostelium discoideum TaxID=44689 RepID=Q54DL2_DICDI|nr:hypothetical protein DDB_G0292144 [Dictyostelium discoideum AX4]EAL61428.1 hypothetical protein DDB_G0292144 [Dictyostelium discoideum AX4]|eukprot:XP_629860.1 hypothetical protein DDB_G0292144 [Dictyostelium discoideum AX4]
MDKKVKDFEFGVEERIILNVGGRIFETYRSTLQSSYEGSLLEIMFSDRNKHLLRPNEKGEYFFDRSSEMFEYILNAYRTGEMELPRQIPYKMFIKELDYFQLPHHNTQCPFNNSNNNINNNVKINNNKNKNENENVNKTKNDNNVNNNVNNNETKTNISPRVFNCSYNPISQLKINTDFKNNDNNNSYDGGCNNNNNNKNNNNNNNNSSVCFCNNNNILSGEKLKILSLERARKEGGGMLETIKNYCYDILLKAAEKGNQYEIIQFKSTDNEEFYSFISNLRNRELLLHDFMNDNFDVYFSEEFGVSHHSYLFQVTFWTRYSTFDMSSTDQVLNEIKQKIIQLSAFIYKKAE